MKRNSSYTLCKNFIKELFDKYNHIEKINFEILDFSNNSIKTNISINGDVKTFDIILRKKERKVSPKVLHNLKNQNKNIDESLSNEECQEYENKNIDSDIQKEFKNNYIMNLMLIYIIRILKMM